ncbi:hypothetical protein BpHYR1_035775 [Brachionus plicatilis]|uniref:UPAR/Ly6 domain-containing protein n=1 Tax=Brachionus plicatilis TaxID=10195 RepID=A0A3M7P4A5_BRAPC|nr:hypothetical protein BpHYR1_035775 [Brachionus plicatilis]
MFRYISFVILLISFELRPISSLMCKSCHTCHGGNFGLMEPRRKVTCSDDQSLCIADVDVLPKITKTEPNKVLIKLGCSTFCPKNHYCCKTNFCNNINQRYINKKIRESISKFSRSKTLVL